ncbi:hypothetical protein EDF51_10225 [Curtobacterium sp. PhB25]|nr:hypothetical protein EDF33_1011323 [Curtobacterium sp. PhB146]TDW51221.1 hypothetical protein EDF52_102316 [Curtobacterium sp. PhB42]TDW55933.1 hypothetical protein EDF47_10437 [Curtobacterium sp. PhB190]TDW73203.1 hypothetical protein EDF51_10225 [Curtobacterium sp. PhB25]
MLRSLTSHERCDPRCINSGSLFPRRHEKVEESRKGSIPAGVLRVATFEPVDVLLHDHVVEAGLHPNAERRTGKSEPRIGSEYREEEFAVSIVVLTDLSPQERDVRCVRRAADDLEERVSSLSPKDALLSFESGSLGLVQESVALRLPRPEPPQENRNECGDSNRDEAQEQGRIIPGPLRSEMRPPARQLGTRARSEDAAAERHRSGNRRTEQGASVLDDSQVHLGVGRQQVRDDPL